MPLRRKFQKHRSLWIKGLHGPLVLVDVNGVEMAGFGWF